jgi:hypothetical protein
MADQDLLSDVWRVLASAVGTSVADQELLQLRQRWGGARVYVQKVPALPTQKALSDCMASGMVSKDAFAAVGCSPAWGQRLLGRRMRR